jgi:hypothetical protein
MSACPAVQMEAANILHTSTRHSDAIVLYTALNSEMYPKNSTPYERNRNLFWFFSPLSFFFSFSLPSAFAYENSQGNIFYLTVKNDRRAEMSDREVSLLNLIWSWEGWRQSSYHRPSSQSLHKQIPLNYFYVHTVHFYCSLFIICTNNCTNIYYNNNLSYYMLYITILFHYIIYYTHFNVILLYYVYCNMILLYYIIYIKILFYFILYYIYYNIIWLCYILYTTTLLYYIIYIKIWLYYILKYYFIYYIYILQYYLIMLHIIYCKIIILYYIY